MDTNIVAFAVVVALVTISPGADMAVVTRAALAFGWRAAFACALGISLGTIAWGAASAGGLAAVLTASVTAFNVVKFAGAAYLVWLGVHTLWGLRAAARQVPAAVPAPAGTPAQGAGDSGEEAQTAEPRPARGLPWNERGMRVAFRQGLVSNLLNPKVGLFYTVMLPQFVAPSDSLLVVGTLLAGIHVAFGLVWLSSYAWAVTRAGDVLRKPRVHMALNGLIGLVLVGLGLRVVLEVV